MLIYLFMLLFTRVTMGKAKIAATVCNQFGVLSDSVDAVRRCVLLDPAQTRTTLHAPALEHILRLLSVSVSEGIHSDTLF